MKKFQYKNNNMKRIILIFLGLFSLAYGQFSNTGAKTRFVNGISLGTKLDSYYNAADSNAIYWRADSVLRAKYRGTARSLAFQGDTTGFGSRFIYNQFGSNLSAQTAKWRITDTGWANILITDSHLRSDSIRSADLRISGQLTMNNAEAIVMKRTNGLGSSVLQMTAADTIAIGNQTQGTVLYGSNPLKFVSGTNRQEMPNLSGTVALMGATNVGSFQAASGSIFLDTDGTIYGVALDIGQDAAGSYAARIGNSNATGRGVAINAGAGQFDALTIRDETLTDTLLRVKGNGTTEVGDSSSNNDSLIVNGILLVRNMSVFRSSGTPVIVNSTNSTTNKIEFQDNATTRGAVGANSSSCFVVANSAGTGIVSTDNGTGITEFKLTSGNNGQIIKLARSAGSYTWGLGVDGANSNFNFYNNGGTSVANINNATGAYTATSDSVAKKNIKDAGLAMPLLKQIKVREYDWKSTDIHEPFGLVAQELYKVTPTYVSKPADSLGRWGVQKAELVPMLIKAIQEQQSKIESLEARLTALEAIINKIKP